MNAELAPFRLLRGVECDIRADGTLDVEDRALAELEWVQLSLHAGQRRPAAELTRMELAVATARKGGATQQSVLNCRPLEDLVPEASR